MWPGSQSQSYSQHNSYRDILGSSSTTTTQLPTATTASINRSGISVATLGRSEGGSVTRLCPHASERQLHACPELQDTLLPFERDTSISTNSGNTGILGNSTPRCFGNASARPTTTTGNTSIVLGRPVQICFQCMCGCLPDTTISWTVRLAALKHALTLTTTATNNDRTFCADKLFRACVGAHMFASVSMSSVASYDYSGTGTRISGDDNTSMLYFLRHSEAYLLSHVASLVTYTSKEAIASACIEVLLSSDLVPQVKLVLTLLGTVLDNDAFIRILHSSSSAYIPRLYHLLHRFTSDPIAVTVAKLLLCGCATHVQAIFHLTGNSATNTTTNSTYFTTTSASKASNSSSAYTVLMRCVERLHTLNNAASVCDEVVLVPIFESSLAIALLGNKHYQQRLALQVKQQQQQVQYGDNSNRQILVLLQDHMLTMLRYCAWSLHYILTSQLRSNSIATSSILSQVLVGDQGKEIVSLCLPNTIGSNSYIQGSESDIYGLLLLHMLLTTSNTTSRGTSNDTTTTTKAIIHPSGCTQPPDAGMLLTTQREDALPSVLLQVVPACNMSQTYGDTYMSQSQVTWNSSETTKPQALLPNNTNTSSTTTTTSTYTATKALQSMYIRNTDLLDRIYERLAHLCNSNSSSLREKCTTADGTAASNPSIFAELVQHANVDGNTDYSTTSSTNSSTSTYCTLLTALYRRLCSSAPDAVHIFHYSRFSNIYMQILLDIAFGSSTTSTTCASPFASNTTSSYAHGICIADICACLIALTRVSSKYGMDIIRYACDAISAIKLAVATSTSYTHTNSCDIMSQDADAIETYDTSNMSILVLLIARLNHYVDVVFRILRRRKAGHARKANNTSTSNSTTTTKSVKPTSTTNATSAELVFDNERDASVYIADQHVCLTVASNLLDVVASIVATTFDGTTTITSNASTIYQSGSSKAKDSKALLYDAIVWIFTLFELLDIGALVPSKHHNRSGSSPCFEHLFDMDICTQFAVILAYIVSNNSTAITSSIDISLIKPLVLWLSKVVSIWSQSTDTSVSSAVVYLFTDVSKSVSLHRYLASTINSITTSSSTSNSNTSKQVLSLIDDYSALLCAWLQYHGVAKHIATMSTVRNAISTATTTSISDASVITNYIYLYMSACLLQQNLNIGAATSNPFVQDIDEQEQDIGIDSWLYLILEAFYTTTNGTSTSTSSSTTTNGSSALPITLVESLLQLIPMQLLAERIVNDYNWNSSNNNNNARQLNSSKLGVAFTSLLQLVPDNVTLESMKQCSRCFLLSLAYQSHTSTNTSTRNVSTPTTDSFMRRCRYASPSKQDLAALWNHCYDITSTLFQLLTGDGYPDVLCTIIKMYGESIDKSLSTNCEDTVLVDAAFISILALQWIDNCQPLITTQSSSSSSTGAVINAIGTSTCTSDYFKQPDSAVKFIDACRHIIVVTVSAISRAQLNSTSHEMCGELCLLLANLISTAYISVCNAATDILLRLQAQGAYTSTSTSNDYAALNTYKSLFSTILQLTSELVVFEKLLSVTSTITTSIESILLSVILHAASVNSTINTISTSTSTSSNMGTNTSTLQYDIQQLIHALLTTRCDTTGGSSQLLLFSSLAIYAQLGCGSGSNSTITGTGAYLLEVFHAIEHHALLTVPTTSSGSCNTANIAYFPNNHSCEGPTQATQAQAYDMCLDTTTTTTTTTTSSECTIYIGLSTLYERFGGFSTMQSLILEHVVGAPTSVNADTMAKQLLCIDGLVAYIILLLDIKNSFNEIANKTTFKRPRIDSIAIEKCFLKAQEFIVGSDILTLNTTSTSISSSSTASISIAEDATFLLQTAAVMYCVVVLTHYHDVLSKGYLQVWVDILQRYIITNISWRDSVQGHMLLAVIDNCYNSGHKSTTSSNCTYYNNNVTSTSSLTKLQLQLERHTIYDYKEIFSTESISHGTKLCIYRNILANISI